MLTAIIIMGLVEENKFDLSSSLRGILPDLAIPQASKITVHHLLLYYQTSQV
jgi:CubicO group peptidase (beta-lactamase class C family)